MPQVSARCFKGNTGSVQLLAQPEAQDTAEDLLENNKNSFLCPDGRGQAVISVNLNGSSGEIATADADSEA